MSRHIILRSMFGCFLSLALSACFDDESTLGTEGAVEIEINGIPKDTAVVSYNGVVLNIPVSVRSTYPDEQMEYAWYYYNNDDAGVYNNDKYEDGYHSAEKIEGKDLSFEVNLPSGTYMFIFEARSNTDGYMRTETMRVTVSTTTSRGFYILKERDGATDLDIYTRQGGMSHDMLTRVLGAPLEGMPENLCATYNQCYLDGLEKAYANMVHVITTKDYRGFRTEDMFQTFDFSTLKYNEFDSGTTDTDEELHAFATDDYTVYCFSNKGMYGLAKGSQKQVSSGRYGFPQGNGASRFMFPFSTTTFYWSNAEHHVSRGGALFERYSLENEEQFDCIACGLNNASGGPWTGKGLFVLENRENGSRCLIKINGGFFGAISGVETIKLNPSFHVAQGELVAVNALSATILYVLHQGRLYAYDWNNDTEREISLPGIPEGETITYVSNQFLNINKSDDFDCLVVVTQSGGQYKVYLFEDLVGGAPISEAEHIAAGTGKVKCVRYITPDTGTLGIALIPRWAWGD